MSTSYSPPRRTIGGYLLVWSLALVAGVAIAIFVPIALRVQWMTLALGGALLLSFAVQLWHGSKQRFIQRVSLSILGSVFVLGAVSLAFGLAILIPG